MLCELQDGLFVSWSWKLQDLTEIGAGLDGAGSAALLVGFSLSRGEL